MWPFLRIFVRLYEIRESIEFTGLYSVQPTDLFYWISKGWRSKIIFLYTDLYIRFLTDLKVFPESYFVIWNSAKFNLFKQLGCINELFMSLCQICQVSLFWPLFQRLCIHYTNTFCLNVHFLTKVLKINSWYALCKLFDDLKGNILLFTWIAVHFFHLD